MLSLLYNDTIFVKSNFTDIVLSVYYVIFSILPINLLYILDQTRDS